ACEAPVDAAILRKGEGARAVAQIETAADDKAEPDLFCRMMRAHDAGEAVAVGDRDRCMTESSRGQHQLVRMRRTAQKREVGGDLQFRVARTAFRKRRHGQTSAAVGRWRASPPGTTRSAAPPRPRPGNSRGSRPRLREDRRWTPRAATIHRQYAPARRPASPGAGAAARPTETAGRRVKARRLQPARAARTTG